MPRLHEKDDFWDEHRLAECNGLDHEKIVPADPLAGVPLVHDTPEYMAKMRELMTQQVYVAQQRLPAGPSHGHTISDPSFGGGVGVYDPNQQVHYVPALDPNQSGQLYAVTHQQWLEHEARRRGQWQAWVAAQMQQNDAKAQQALAGLGGVEPRKRRLRDPGILGAALNSLLGDGK